MSLKVLSVFQCNQGQVGGSLRHRPEAPGVPLQAFQALLNGYNQYLGLSVASPGVPACLHILMYEGHGHLERDRCHHRGDQHRNGEGIAPLEASEAGVDSR